MPFICEIVIFLRVNTLVVVYIKLCRVIRDNIFIRTIAYNQIISVNF
jgi:hypothetical protein